jgi:hypothetical protein
VGMHAVKCMIAVVFCAVFLAGVPTFCGAQQDFLPAELADLKLGIPMDSVMERISKSGAYSKVPFPTSKRTQLTWFPVDNPMYKKVEFWFTEKDRLFMTRFGLSDESRWDAAAVKKQFLEKYLGAWLAPKRFRQDPNDMIVYLPEDPQKGPFLEVTNMKSGEKFFELFDKRIDGEDTPLPEATGGSAKPSQTPAR